jgi:hypothetical protein
MDEGLNWWTWRVVIAISFLFACLLVWSFFDLLFLVLGSKGEATITEVYTIPSRRGEDPVVIEYTFNDGGERKGKTNLGQGALAPAVGERFEIQYLPDWFPAGPDGARPARPFNWIVLILLLLSTLGIGIFTYRAIAVSREPPPKRSRKR